MRRAWLGGWIVLLACCCYRTAGAQTNFWYWEQSAPWESPYWSLGIPPNSEQTVAIPNPGWKAVAINWATAQNYPGSMTVSNLHVSAPEGGFSTLLLNYVGTGLPFRVGNGCTLGFNALLLNLYSAFGVEGAAGGRFSLFPGTFSQEGGYTWATNVVTSIVGGTMTLTNATAVFGRVEVGLFSDTNSSGLVVQAGGNTSGSFDFRHGRFELVEGELRGTLALGNQGRGELEQHGGTNRARIALGVGSYFAGTGIYRMHGGTVESESISIGADNYTSWGLFEQLGGAARVGDLTIGSYQQGEGRYLLCGGALSIGHLLIDNGTLEQTGGTTCVSNAVVLSGYLNPRGGMQVPRVQLSGGTMSMPGLTLGPMCQATQVEGTNDISGQLLLDVGGPGESDGVYRLADGALRTVVTCVQSRYSWPFLSAQFVQDGGVHVSALLVNRGRYTLSSGKLAADTIASTGELVVSNSPAEPQLVNADHLELAGRLLFNSASQQFGRLLLIGDATVSFGPGAGTLAFAESSGSLWTNWAVLTVKDWNGSTNGMGAQRLLFGQSASALSPAQLLQVRFVNPMASGRIYTARLLSSGEVVPAAAQDYDFIRTNDTVTITGYAGPGGDLVIPETFNGLPVTEIGRAAFHGLTNVTSITVPNSVTRIGEDAFSFSSSLVLVALGSGVSSVARSAFNSSYNLTAIEVDPGNALFSTVDGILFNKDGTSLLRCPSGKSGALTVPHGVMMLADYAFDGCKRLATVIIPPTVTTIGNGAFRNCTGLASMALPDNVTDLGESAFRDCFSMTNVTIRNGLAVIEPYLFGNCRALVKASFGNQVATVGQRAFIGCTNLTAILLPNSVTNIDAEAFYGCSSLPAIPSPDSLKTIGVWAFYGCSNLQNVVIPNSVSRLGPYTFLNCARLTNASFGPGMTFIEHTAFMNCNNMLTFSVDPLNPTYASVDGVLFDKTRTTLVNVPAGKCGPYAVGPPVTSVAASAFSGCAKVTGVTIGSTVTNIGPWTFSGCTSLSTVVVGANVKALGYYAFNSVNLRAIYFLGDAPGTEDRVFYDQSRTTVYYLPGTAGWGPLFGGRPTAPWGPEIDVGLGTFGVQAQGFGLPIGWTGQRTVVVEARNELSGGNWVALSTNVLTDGTGFFSDPSWTNYPARFYRVRPQ